MLYREIAEKLSIQQQKFVLRHVRDGMAVQYRFAGVRSTDRQTRDSLIRLRLVAGVGMGPPRHTVLTALGVEVASAILAVYAEGIADAGCGRSNVVTSPRRRLVAVDQPELALAPG